MLIYDNVWLIGRHTSFVNTKKTESWAGKGVKGREEEWVVDGKFLVGGLTKVCNKR